jgi:hypothetical protein
MYIILGTGVRTNNDCHDTDVLNEKQAHQIQS